MSVLYKVAVWKCYYENFNTKFKYVQILYIYTYIF